MVGIALRIWLALLPALLGGCDSAGFGKPPIDAEWHRRTLVTSHLAPWLAHAPTDSGLYRADFSRTWQPKGAAGADLTVQSRLVYAFIAGYEVTGDRRYLQAATTGADFLLAHFHDPVHGGFFNRVAADGKVVDDAKLSYGHAFALFALSHMARVTKDERYRSAALRTWQEIDRGLRDPLGGFAAKASRSFAAAPGKNTQNPVMHMFEALLALCEATGDPDALRGATALGNFVLYKLLQGYPDGSAAIPEWYDDQWRPLPTAEQGGYTDIGHQFEWSHLLLKAQEAGLAGVFPAASGRLLQYALKVGYDEDNGGIYDRAYPEGKVDRDKYWWQQSECLRALIAAGANGGGGALWRRYEQTLALVRAEFLDEQNGGWRFADKRLCSQRGCPDSQLDPYHMAGMHLAAIRAAEGRR